MMAEKEIEFESIVVTPEMASAAMQELWPAELKEHQNEVEVMTRVYAALLRLDPKLTVT